MDVMNFEAQISWYVLVFPQDSFYRGLTAEESERVHEYNFDHPGNKVLIYIAIGL